MAKYPASLFRWLRIAAPLALMVAFAAGACGLWRISRGHPVEYLRWRYMVMFQVPVAPVEDFSIVVDKSERRLTVYDHAEAVAVFRVALSAFGLEPRLTYEDKRTPEGVFRIASMQYQSVFGPRQMLLETTELSLNHYRAQYGADAASALAAWEAAHGPLDTIWETYDFNSAHPHQPLWNDILIHGGGSDRDWTWGCIALDDADLIRLFDLLRRSSSGGLGVSVSIHP